jgi:signal transduction histidine kinase
MSYRSIKRVLGETSLERKCRFLFGACLLLLITASFWWYGSQTEELVYQQNRNTGRLLVDQVMLNEHWENFEALASRPLVQHLADKLSRQEYTWRFLLPSSPEEEFKPRDAFERKLLAEFLAVDPLQAVEQESPEFEDRLSSDQSEYQYYQPIRAQDSCLAACHKAPPGGLGIGWSDADPGLRASVGRSTAQSKGELMAVVQVTIPNGPTQRALNWNRAILLSTAIVTVFLAMVAAYVIVRYVIVKPLKHLRDVSDAISHGNTALRAEIRTGDEFEALAVAFNRMLRHLVTVQDELRQVNVNLDNKVDELAQANMQLYEMNRIKSDFLATMSHELRTPLNSILGFSDVLGSIDALDDKQKRYVENIQKSGRMLLEMINNILDLAKIESGKTELRLTEFRIEQIVGAQCDMARPLTEKKNIDLEIHLADDLPPLRQDQARVQQILNNLLSNAIKFTPEGGRITVSARCGPAESIVLEVADTGVGIAEEDQQTVFEKFRQGKTALPGGDAMTREYSGTGLGLSIVRELCRLLGGEVSVESELGKGSVFTVTLPCALDDQAAMDTPGTDRLEELSRPRLERPPRDASADATASAGSGR